MSRLGEAFEDGPVELGLGAADRRARPPCPSPRRDREPRAAVGAGIDDSGRVRIPIAASLRPSSSRSPRSSSSETGRRARTTRSPPRACSRRRRWRTVSPTRSSSVSIFSAGTRIDRRSPFSLGADHRVDRRSSRVPRGAGRRGRGRRRGDRRGDARGVRREPEDDIGDRLPVAVHVTAQPVGRAQQRADEPGGEGAPVAGAGEHVLHRVRERADLRRARSCPAAPLIVCVSRKSESTASASARPASSASSGVDHAVQALARLVAEDLEELGIGGAMASVTSAPTPDR